MSVKRHPLRDAAAYREHLRCTDRGMKNEWFKRQGLLSLEGLYNQLSKHLIETAVRKNAREVV